MFMILLHSRLYTICTAQPRRGGSAAPARRKTREISSQGCRRGRLGAGLAALILVGLQSVAHAAETIETTLIAEVREEANVAGRRVAKLAPPAVLHQGQVVYYTVRILNRGSEPARDVVVVQRVPENTAYVPKSAGGPGADIAFSADAGQTFAKEGQLIVVEPSFPSSDLP